LLLGGCGLKPKNSTTLCGPPRMAFQFFARSQLKPSIHARCCLEGFRAEAIQDTCRVMLKRLSGQCTLILCARSCVKGFGLAHAHTLRKVSLKEPIMYPPFK
jgi:hypothetical protein